MHNISLTEGDQQVPESQQIYYQCSVCKTFLSSKGKLAEHKKKKHSAQNDGERSKQLEDSKSNEEITTADLVKTTGKRQLSKGQLNCSYCKNLIPSRYDCYLISEQKRDIFSEYYACQKCFKKLI